MKKFLVVFVVLALLLSLTVPALAAKPDVAPGQAKKVEKVKIEKEVRKEEQKEKENGAEKYEFFLSGDVMPSPPYGLSDVEGSDEKSKLIVNQPNGKPIANVTGILKGLMPDTEYTVYISNGYEMYSEIGWNTVGTYDLAFVYGTSTYMHDFDITGQVDGVLEAEGGYPANGAPYSFPYNETITDAMIDGNVITYTSTYENGYWYSVELVIQSDGTLIGTWSNDSQGGGDIYSTSGNAVFETSGDGWWPGLLTPQLPAFTVMTDEEGHVSWHVNILCEMVECVEGEIEFSVWINGPGGTLLISETVVLECDCEPELEIIPIPE